MKKKGTLWVCVWQFSGSDTGHVAAYSNFFFFVISLGSLDFAKMNSKLFSCSFSVTIQSL